MAERWVAARPGGLEGFDLVSYDVPPPVSGEVTVEVRAAGVNPADASHVAEGRRGPFPRGVGYEVAGVLTAIGPDTEIASGGGAVGDEVLAFRVLGGWASDMSVPARDVFAKPAALTFEQAANLLLAATTASEMLHVTGVEPGETVLAHGASGAVGVSLLQQAALLGVRVVGTCSSRRSPEVRRFGGEPVAYGAGLEGRVREAAREGIAAALDCVGTDEAVEVSLAVVPERARVVTIAAKQLGARVGIRVIGGDLPKSAAYRDGSAPASCGWRPREVLKSRWPAPTRSTGRWTRRSSSSTGIPAASWHSSQRTRARGAQRVRSARRRSEVPRRWRRYVTVGAMTHRAAAYRTP